MTQAGGSPSVTPRSPVVRLPGRASSARLRRAHRQGGAHVRLGSSRGVWRGVPGAPRAARRWPSRAALVVPLSGAGADGSTRDPFLWPFATTSPWNVPVGSGVRFASDTDPRTLDLQAVPGVNIDVQAYSQPIYRASSSDPLRTVTDPHGATQYRIPDAATPAVGTDADLHVVDPTDHWVDECWKAVRGCPPAI